MAKKRFTDVEIWDKEWFMNLTPTHKCLLRYIFDKCDPSGCWNPNWKLASLHINDTVSIEDLKHIPEDQYEILENGKIFIPDFIMFQYGKLSMECRPHIPIMSVIEKNGLTDRLSYLIEERGSSVKAIRKRLTESAKLDVFKHDEFQCQYCGIRGGEKDLVVDHIIPVINSGDNSFNNLTTSCHNCNSKKRDSNVFEFIKINNISVLYNLSKKLDTLYNKSDTLEEKEKEKEKDKEKDKGKKQEKKVEPPKPINGFRQTPTLEDVVDLPPIIKERSIEKYLFSKSIRLTGEEVDTLWEIFRVENLTGKNFYANKEKVYTHFMGWIKFQDKKTITNANTWSGNRSNQTGNSKAEQGKTFVSD